MRTSRLLLLVAAAIVAACTPVPTPKTPPAAAPAAMERVAPSSSSKPKPTPKSAEARSSSVPLGPNNWNKDLTADQIAVLRDAGTETPFTSPLLEEHRKGTFVSADCDEPVFRSEQKYDSGTGWPSFWAPISADAVIEKTDTTLGYERVEILSKCGGHLGHVFDDGPEPTGKRYCMNGLALKFIPDPGQ